MDDDDDFTFPTVAAAREAAPPVGQLGRGDGDHGLQLPLPDLAGAPSPLWPFITGSPKANAPSSSPPPMHKDNEEAPPVPGTTGRAEHRTETADDQEERMDLLWEGAAATTATKAPTPPPNSNPRRAEANNDDDKQRAAALADAERMDKLWESFNEELLLLRRARSKSAAADRPGGGAARPPGGLDAADHWYLCSYSPSDDAGSEVDTSLASSSPAEGRRGYGCAPTMLRASSRAGGAGQFCGSGSPRRRGRSRGAAAGWELLLRLFRRLFAVDKAPASSSRGHASIYVP